VSDDKFKSTESLPAVKSSRLSVQPSTEDELSSSQPNVCLSGSSTAPETELKSSRVQTPSSGTFTGDEEELRGTGSDERKAESTDDDSGSAASVDEAGRLDHQRWRSLDRRVTSCDSWEKRRRSTDRALEASEGSKRFAVRVRSADPEPRIAVEAPEPASESTVVLDAGHQSDDEKSTEDLTLDIDTALAEVMSEIESLGLGRVVLSGNITETDELTPPSPSTGRKTETPSYTIPRQDFEDAPDLVIGLPTGSGGPQSSPKSLTSDQTSVPDRKLSVDSASSSDGISGEVASPARSLTAAEVFAKADQCTIKKAAVVTGPQVDRTASVADAAPSRPTPACRARSVDAATVLTAGGTAQRSFSPPSRRPQPLPKTKPTRRSDRPFPTPADIRPDVEFVRSLVPPFGDSGVVVTRTFTLPRDPDAGRGRPDSTGGRTEVGRSMSVGDATAAVVESALQPQTGTTRDPSPASKPPVKVKPPVKKKPARAGEVIKRLQESLAQQGSVSVSAPQ